MVHQGGGKGWTDGTAMCAALFAVGIGCGATTPPVPSPPTPLSAAPPVAVLPDLSEVPEPAHLIGLGRWKNPEATLKMIYEWTGIRMNTTDLAAEAFDKNLAAALSFDTPVDAVVALDDKGGAGDMMPFFAVAVGVRSLDAARQAAQAVGTVTEIRPFEYKVNLRHGKRKSDKPFCVLAAAAGPAPGRFVCGRRERDVESLRAYMTRTLPKRDFGAADLHLEFHIAPAVEVYGPMINQGLHIGAALAPRKLEIGEPAFDRALERAAAAISDELGAVIAEADSLTFDLTMASDRATTSGTLKLRGQRSWTAGVLANEAVRAAPPPNMFWRLPASATSASYYFPPEARRFDAIRRTLAELLDGWLLHDGLAPADRAQVSALLNDKLSSFDAPWVSAGGPFSPPPATTKNKVAPSPPAASKDNPVREAIERSGWRLFGFGAPNQVPDLLKTLSSSLSRAKVQAFLKSKLSAMSSELAGEDKNWVSAVSMKGVPPPKDLPKASLAFEVLLSIEGGAPESTGKIAAAKKSKTLAPPLKLYVFVVTEAAQTWVALGGDKVELTKPLLAALEGSPEAGTLSSNPDTAPLRSETLSAASFTTIESVLQAWSSPAAWFDGNGAHSMAGSHALLASTPHQGRTPILIRSEVTAPAGISWTIRADIPKGVVEDAIILAASSGFSGLARP